MSGRTEYLIYFRPERTALGTVPQWYFVAASESERADAIRNGGADVSDNDAHWRAFERIERSELGVRL
jgi:hypothetical protein